VLFASALLLSFSHVKDVFAATSDVIEILLLDTVEKRLSNL
jgi:hypothetical protein